MEVEGDKKDNTEEKEEERKQNNRTMSGYQLKGQRKIV